MSTEPPNGSGKSVRPDAALNLRRTSHRILSSVTADLEGFHFNRAVARVHELANLLGDTPRTECDQEVKQAWQEALDILIQLIGPMMPHLGEELWAHQGHKGLLADEPWPTANPDLLQNELVTIIVQVNGKVRGRLQIAPDQDDKNVVRSALDLENVKRAIGSSSVNKTIVVPNRVVNVVV